MTDEEFYSIPLPQFGKEAPKKIRLLKYGLNPTKEGPLFLTKEAAQEIMARFRENGNSLIWDIDHKSEMGWLPDEERGGVGGLLLSEEEDGIYAINEWTDRGKELIESGRYIYFSPSIKKSVFQDGHVVREIRAAAITNYPKMKKITPLLLSEMNGGVRPYPSESLVVKVRPMKQLYYILGELMNTSQECMSFYGQGEPSDLADMISRSLPSWIQTASEILEKLDPQGETEMSEQITEQDNKKGAKMKKDPSLTQPENESKEKEIDAGYSELYSFASQLTGKTDIDEIKGILRANAYNQNKLKEQLSSSQKNEVTLLVENGIEKGLINRAEKEDYLRLSKKEVSAFLSNAIPMYQPVSEKLTPVVHDADEETYLKEAQMIVNTAFKI